MVKKILLLIPLRPTPPTTTQLGSNPRPEHTLQAAISRIPHRTQERHVGLSCGHPSGSKYRVPAHAKLHPEIATKLWLSIPSWSRRSTADTAAATAAATSSTPTSPTVPTTATIHELFKSPPTEFNHAQLRNKPFCLLSERSWPRPKRFPRAWFHSRDQFHLKSNESGSEQRH